MEPVLPPAPGLPASRDVPDYDGLGFFAAQEIPYALVENDVVDGAGNVVKKGVEFIDLLVDDALPPGAGPSGFIQRCGWLADCSQYSGSQQRLVGNLPSTVEDPAMTPQDRNDCFYLQRGDGQYLINTPTGDLGVGAHDPSAGPAMDKRVQIAKVVSIPYRWSRDPAAQGDPRVVHIILCYNGPSVG
jgi:hypothetical protein